MEFNLSPLKYEEESLFILKSLFTLLLFAISVSISLYYFWTHGRSFSRRFNKLPGPLTLPFVGCSYLIFNTSKIHYTIGRCAKKYGNKARFWLGHIPYLITYDVDTIQKILSDPAHSSKSEAYSNSSFMVGQGLVSAPVEKWKKDRRVMIPCLKSTMFSGYVQNFNKNSKLMVNVLKETLENNASDIREYYARCSMDIVFETFLDIEFNLQERPESRFYEAFTTCLELIGKKLLQPWIRPRFMYSLLGYKKMEDEAMNVLKEAFDTNIIKEKIYEWKLNLEAEGDGMDPQKKLAHLLYLNREDPLDIFHQFVTVMAGGFDTTATVLNHTSYFLALYPEFQEKVWQEIQSIYQGDPFHELTLEDLSNLKYTELVIKESMRMLTPTPILGRMLGQDLVLKDGSIVPKNSNILIPAIHLHHDPKVWPEPLKFIPERFTPENSKGRSPYAFLSFSGGPRGCFAPKYAMMLIKVLISNIIINFEISTKKPFEDCEIQYGVVTHVSGGLPVTLTLRKNN